MRALTLRPSTVLMVSLIALTSWLPSLALADNVVGLLVTSTADRYQLKVNEFSEPLTIEATDTVVETLKHLKNGNLIVGTGQLQLEAKKVQLDAVQSVGLQELIGTWQSSSFEVFEFRGFNKLIRYLPMERESGDFRLTYAETFSYVLTPENGNTYSIFITDNHNRLMVGTLHLAEHKLLLTVYDSQTGQESEKISLSPLFLK